MTGRNTIGAILLLWLALPFVTVHAQEAGRSGGVDRRRVRELRQRQRSGEARSAEESDYLARALELRRRAVPRERRGAALPSPTAQDVRYGEHERNVLDFWRAPSERPTPLLIFIHGGGFRAGDKRSLSAAVLRRCLPSGVSVAAINYRFVQHEPLPASMYDAARALQFLRSRAEEWNIDRTRIAAYGGSAGGCISLWLAFHDDLADPDSDDPVARESTRLTAAGGMGAQTSLDPNLLREWLGEEILQYPGLARKFGAETIRELLADPGSRTLFEEVSPLNHLTADDPPVFLSYPPDVPLTPGSSHGTRVHHPTFGKKLREAVEPLGIECVLRIAREPPKDGYRDMLDFFFRKFGIEGAAR